MKRLIIAVDCDDVLVPTTPFFVDAYNVQYGTAVQLSQAHQVSTDAWGADSAVVSERLASLMETEGYRLLAPSAEAIEVLAGLAQHHELHVVTARREHERELTQRMIDDMLPDVFTSLELVGWEGSKGLVCQKLGADVLIDDSARHLHDAIKCGLPKQGALIFGNYSWNEKDSGHEDLTLCHDWRAVKKVIDTIAGAE